MTILFSPSDEIFSEVQIIAEVPIFLFDLFNTLKLEQALIDGVEVDFISIG